MCGICGVWEYGAATGNVGPALVRRMRDVMTHRGPDDAGELIFDEGRGGFGFRRLSIIDLSAAGHQPMRGCTDRVWLVFNGEIYNHAELREGLEQRGHVYASRTDSETILHLYEERGLDFVHDIEGDYAIALWDADREQLVLARDRAGVKPLYFYQQGGRFIFASEIKAILEHPALTPDVNEEALYHYLTFVTTPAPQTLFRDVQKLPAGHMLVVNRQGEARTTQYWDALPPESPVVRTEAEHQKNILELLRASIKKRMMADVPFGVFLSGGVDSSANVALMSELMTQPVRTFTVGFHDTEELNELESARAISKRFGTDHHEVMIGREEMMKFLPELIFHQDEPIADPVCVPLYYVSKLARDTGTIVVQVGEGSDEIFGGYDWFRTYLQIEERFWRHAERFPLPARHAAAVLATPLVKRVLKKRMASELVRRLGANESLFWGGAVVFDETMKQKLLSTEMRRRSNGLSTYSVVREYQETIAAARPNSDYAARMTYLELKLRLPELLLMRVDKITMATSVEARVPFLDHHLIEYAMGLPRNLKVKGTTGKHILKRALETVLPADVLYKPKRGFGAPTREWFRGSGGEGLVAQLMNSAIRERNFFDYSFVQRMADEHRREIRDWSANLWGARPVRPRRVASTQYHERNHEEFRQSFAIGRTADEPSAFPGNSMSDPAFIPVPTETSAAAVTPVEAGAFGSFASGVALTIVTRLLMLLGTVGGSVIVARWLGPEGLGALAVLNTTIVLSLTIGTLGLTSANTYFIARDRKRLAPVWANAIAFALVGGALAAGVVVAIAKFMPTLFGGVSSDLVLIAALSIPFQFLLAFGLNVLLAMDRIRRLNFMDAMAPVLALFNAIFVLLILRSSLKVLVSFNSGATVVLSGFMIWSIARVVTRQPERPRFRPNGKLLKAALAYGLKFCIPLIAAILIFRADLLIVNHFRGAAEAGVYAVASQVANLLTMLPAVVGTLLFPRVASFQDPRGEFAIRVTRHVSFVMLMMCALVAAGSFLLPMIYGQRFVDATIQLLILLPGICLIGIESVLVQHFTGTGLPRAIPIFWLITLAVNIGLNLVLVPLFGARGAASVSTLSYALIFVLVAFYFWRKTGRRVAETFFLRRGELQALFTSSYRVFSR